MSTSTYRAVQATPDGRFDLVERSCPMVETLPLADAGAGYDRMLSGAARFRVVLTVG